jgi:hypothetical protein
VAPESTALAADATAAATGRPELGKRDREREEWGGEERRRSLRRQNRRGTKPMLVSRKLLVFFEILGALNGRVGFASFFCAVRDLLPRLVCFSAARGRIPLGVWVSTF